MAAKSLKSPNSFIIHPRQVILVSHHMFLGPRNPFGMFKLQWHDYIIVKSKIQFALRDYLLTFINIIYLLTRFINDLLFCIFPGLTMSASIVNQETCPICREDLGDASDVVGVRPKGADGINSGSVQRGDDGRFSWWKSSLKMSKTVHQSKRHWKP